MPYAFTEADKADEARFTGFSQGIGRLAPGATPADVRTQSDLIVRRNMQRISASGGPDGGWYSQIVEANGYTIKATPLREYLRRLACARAAADPACGRAGPADRLRKRREHDAGALVGAAEGA